MKSKNYCYTRFSIESKREDFEPDKMTELLGLTPDETHRIGDEFAGGKIGFSSWVFGTCYEYDVIVENQMMRTIKPLLGKVEILKQIKKDYDVEFYLEVVPSVYSKEPAPCLAPSLEIMKFCCETETNIDIDLYVVK